MIEYTTIVRNQQETTKFLYKMENFGLSPNYRLTPKRFPIIIWWENKRKVRFEYMNKKKVFALYSNQPKAGKSTVCEHLQDEYGFKIVSFAQRIKSMIYVLLQGLMSDEDIYKGLNKDKDMMTPFGVTFRHLLQTLGTEWGRELVHPLIWYITQYSNIQDTEKNVAIDDMRFDNEYSESSKDFNMTYVKLFGRETNAPKETHKSEGNLDNKHFHFPLDNSGTEKELKEQIDILCGN